MRPSSIWSWMPPTRRGDDRAALPHRLGDGQAEALGEALLHDDVGAPLERVDDHRVLVGVGHRQQREVHAAADVARQRRARPPRPPRTPRRPRDRRRRPSRPGPASTRCGSSSAPDVLGEAREHAERVLQPVPARDLHDQRRRRAAAARSSISSAARSTRPDAAVEPLEDRARRVVAVGGEPGGAQHGGRPLGERHRLVLGRERVDRGRRSPSTLVGVEPLPGVAPRARRRTRRPARRTG